MRITRMILMLGVLAGAAGCDETPVSLPEAAGVAVAGTAMTLAVGDAAPVAAQVVDQNGQVMQGLTPVFSTDNPGVATVGTDGVVRGVTPGTANITAAYGSSTATMRVTVTANRRNELQSLEVMADSVVADRRAGAQVVAVRAENAFGQAVCPELTLRSSDPSVATVRMAGACRIEVTPWFAGEATITAEADGRSDTFRVRVTSTGQIAFFSARPSGEELVAGATVSYSVRVLDQNNQPLANQRVNFEASVGTLSAATVATDENGLATVQWQIPTHLRQLGQNHTISFRVPLPNGRIAFRDETVFINGASLAEIALYGAVGWHNTSALKRLDPPTLHAPRGSDVTVGASGLDQYGNIRMVDFTFTLTGSASFSCSPAGSLVTSGIEYTCIYNWYYSAGTATVTARAATGEERAIQVVFN